MKNLFIKWLTVMMFVTLLCPVAHMEEVQPQPEYTELVEIGEIDAIVSESSEISYEGETEEDSLTEIINDESDVVFEAMADLEEQDNDEYDMCVFAGEEMYESNSDLPLSWWQDPGFMAYLKTFDTNNNGSLSQQECDAVKVMNLPADVGDDIFGLDQFPNIEVFTCHSPNFNRFKGLEEAGSLKTVDLSGCTNMRGTLDFRCFNNINNFNNLTTINVSGCTSLDGIECDAPSLTSLNISGCTSLTNISCEGTAVSSLDVRDCINLTSLYCGNNRLTSLDVSKNTKLYRLGCWGNKIKTLNITNCPELVSLVKNGKSSTIDGVISHEYDGDEWYYLEYDSGVNLITGIVATPDIPAAPAPAPAPATPTIPAVKKAGKTTVSAAPGSVYQLDLGGVSGKAFKSSKKKVAVVNGAGQVTIRGAGKTKITFKVGKKKRTVTLTVKDPTIPTSVSLNPVNTAVKVGDAITLTPVISTETNSTFKWKSSNKKVASVSNGVVTFKKASKVTITATAKRGKKRAKVTFRVSK